MTDARETLIELRNLKTHFHMEWGVVPAVDGVNLDIYKNRTLGLVGESGCGKSVLSLTIMGLLAKPMAEVSGEILFHRQDGAVLDLARLDPRGKEIRGIRGREIAMIFQEPMTSLNPVYTIGRQIMEVIRLHQKASKREAYQKTIEMLTRVGIPSARQRVNEFPHQLSGGMRQRVMISMALACNPALLIADEPTTALDVTIQAQILELMEGLRRDFNTSILMITHSLGVVASMSDEVAVMYLGQVVEYGSVRDVFKRHYHPYTEGLLQSVPVVGERRLRLNPIQGTVPEPQNIPHSCRFLERCPQKKKECMEPPPIFEVEAGHGVRCWLYSGRAVPHA